MATSLEHRSLEDASRAAEIPLKLAADITKLMKSGPLLLKAAEEAQAKGDKEKAYILSMKYLNMVTTVKRSETYKSDQRYYDGMLGGRRFREVLEMAEQLSKDLEALYTEKSKKSSGNRAVTVTSTPKVREQGFDPSTAVT